MFYCSILILVMVTCSHIFLPTRTNASRFLRRETKSASAQEVSSFQRQNVTFFENLPCIYDWIQTTEWPHHYKDFSHPLYACGDDWVYKHVWKAGGTTISRQCRPDHTTHIKATIRNPYHETILASHKIFTFVRDPIDHFVSGFSECAVRESPQGLQGKLQPTNESVLHYLNDLRSHPCFLHSIPQVFYLLSQARAHNPDHYLKRVEYVGDISNIEQFFHIQGLPWNTSKVDKRHNDSQNPFFNKFGSKTDFLGLREKLSDAVVEKICNFVAVDYCFFDYSPPGICAGRAEKVCQRTCPAKENTKRSSRAT